MGQGAYILGCEGPRLKTEEATFFGKADPWGFILFARNVETPDQLRDLCAQLRQSVGRDAPILIDQEGGRVQRMRAPNWREWTPPLDFCTLADEDAARAMRLRYQLIGHELRDVGIDSNCSPMADIAQPDTHPFLRNRCYGLNAHDVTERSRAAANGSLDAGVLPVMKHIPGHGRGAVDSHLELPLVECNRATLMGSDFAVFGALSDLPMAMTSHVVYSDLDDQPATTSKTIVTLIRDTIGFGGLLMTDDVSMEALVGTVAERSERSMEAGCDMLLHCNGKIGDMRDVIAACGQMTDAAQTRADAALTWRRAPEPIDIAAVEAELQVLLKDQAFA